MLKVVFSIIAAKWSCIVLKLYSVQHGYEGLQQHVLHTALSHIAQIAINHIAMTTTQQSLEIAISFTITQSYIVDRVPDRVATMRLPMDHMLE